LAEKYDATIYLLHVVQESKIPEGFEDFLKAEKIEKPKVQAYKEKIGQRIIEIGQEQAKSKGVENVKTAVLLGDFHRKNPTVGRCQRNRYDYNGKSRTGRDKIAVFRKRFQQGL
jgi:hypothetical protein